MFTFNEFEKYKKHYVPKAKSIFVKKYSCHWNTVTVQFDFKDHVHYAMFFNSAGRLQDVLIPKSSWENGNIEKTTFLYNRHNKLIYLITTKFRAQIFISSIKIYYDSKNRINYECIENDTEEDSHKYYFHEYEGDWHIVTCCYNHDDAIDYIIKEKFNSKGKVVEYKELKYGEDLDFFKKYIYSDDGKLLFTFSLGEDHLVLTETQHRENIVTTIDRRNSNSISVDETQTQYNNKGHWIKKCTLRNGHLKWIEERVIKYYD